jgi:hypothetical protein
MKRLRGDCNTRVVQDAAFVLLRCLLLKLSEGERRG